MIDRRISGIVAAAFCLATQCAHAASSDWVRVAGAAVRVVVAGNPGTDGPLRGALQIELEPGWKTYWRDPGDAGVPPNVSMQVNGATGDVAIGFPAPRRQSDGYSVWAGYDRPVAFALTITPPQAWGALEFSVFLGVCETICVPVQADLSIEPDRTAATPAEQTVVQKAFEALPGSPRDGFRVVASRIVGDDLLVEAETPDGDTELFLASTHGRMFGLPQAEQAGSAFRVPLLSVTTDTAEEVSYTLVSGERAVTGTILVGE